EMNRQNNTRLGQAVERTLSLATNVVTVGLAIQMALARQRRVMEANQRTREFLGNIVVSNAEAIKEHTEAIGDAYNSPLIAMGKITQAHDELMAALDSADRLRDEGIAAARENVARLGQLSATLQERSQALLEQGKDEADSVEA
ncbi:MAG TPA: toxic anion resistance protein, partial [Dehalococcoidia bacterium]|nr:toxic anion resistance protein [Dehalococcoidia bacterium]